MAYVKSIYDFGGNKYDIKDAAAMKDVDLVGSDLSFYDGDQNLIKTVTLSGGAQKWTATFTQQYNGTKRRSMALVPSDFTIDDVKVGDIIVAQSTNQYTDVPTGWMINYNAGDSSQVGILTVNNITDLNLNYPLGYKYIFIVDYIDKTNNRVYIYMIPPHYRDHFEDVLSTATQDGAASIASLAKFRPYYLVDDDYLSVVNWPNVDTGDFTSFKYSPKSMTMLFDDGRYAQWISINATIGAANTIFVYNPYLGNSSTHGEAFLGKPEYMCSSGTLMHPVQTIDRVKGPSIYSTDTYYDRLTPFAPGSYASIIAYQILLGHWY